MNSTPAGPPIAAIVSQYTPFSSMHNPPHVGSFWKNLMEELIDAGTRYSGACVAGGGEDLLRLQV